MEPSVVDRILEEYDIAYLVTNRALIVVELGGATGVLPGEPSDCMGRDLTDVVPELIGSEQVLADILAGELPRYVLPFVNRETVDGGIAYVTMVDLPSRNASGQITGVTHLVQDVTETVVVDQEFFRMANRVSLLQEQLTEINQELVAANAELQRLSDMKSQFISVAAHELAKPLTPIQGYAEMLLDGDFGPLSDKQRERVRVVKRSADRLRSLAAQLLDVTRIEAERVDLLLQPKDLAALVEDLVAELAPLVSEKSQSIEVNAHPGLPAALIDETRAAQIIANLLSNAHLYTPEGGHIVVSLTPARSEGFLRVSVADNGLGISAEDQEQLFSRFFRAASAIKSGSGGTGLGLRIAKSLAELHGGQISFDSEPGRGSTFHVTFPVANGEASLAGAEYDG